ncbi:MAG: DsbE family thiol:disulfide interchange protein [Ostreibacterium sp.]
MKKSILLAVLIGGVFIALMITFAAGLKNDPNALDLVTKGEKISQFSLPLLTSDKLFTNNDFKTDKPYYLINFFGSWCPECYKEHSYLMQLSKTETIYGVNWKDTRRDGLAFIQKMGNPFNTILVDANSELAIDLGVYGAPETFLISKDGTILFRHISALDEEVWQRDFIPKIKAL